MARTDFNRPVLPTPAAVTFADALVHQLDTGRSALSPARPPKRAHDRNR